MSVEIEPMAGPVVEGSTLSIISNGTWGGEPPITYAYQWYGDGVILSGKIDNSFVVPLGSIGKSYYCEVTATNSLGSASEPSNILGPVIGVLPGTPANTVAPAVTGTTQVGSSLSCSTGTWTGTAPITYTRQWKRAPNTVIPGATGASYTLVVGDVGLSILCTVTAHNAVANASANSNTVGPVTAAATAPVNTTLPDVSGTEMEGQPLISTNGIWSGTTPITYQYQWYQVEIEEPPPLASPPVSTASPTVSGSTSRGSTLHVTNGTWSGFPAPTFTYQWKRLPSTLIGISSSSYTTVPADVGFDLTCTVTATNASGTASQAASNSRGPIVEPVPGASLTDDEGEILLDDEGAELTT